MQNVTKGQDFGATLSKWAQDRECLQAAEERRLLRHADFVGGEMMALLTEAGSRSVYSSVHKMSL